MRRLQLFKSFEMGKTRKIGFHALIGGQAKPGWRPAAEIGEAGGAGDALHIFEWNAGAIAGANQGSDTGARDAVNGDVRVDQGANHPDMCDAAREATRQGKPYAGTFGGWALFIGGKGAKFVLRIAQPIEGVGYFVFEHSSVYFRTTWAARGHLV